MKHNDVLLKHNEVLLFLNYLPKKIIQLHAQDDHIGDISGFVLHDFCNESCFNINKLAYFVDNPDFNCFKGIAGICNHEAGFCSDVDIWSQPEQYRSYLNASPFNNKVRSIEQASLKNNGKASSEQGFMDILAQELEIDNPIYVSWAMKHGNNGFLLVENNDDAAEFIEEHLPQGVYLLSFCPIY
jgi:hypothetical protein